MSVINLRYGGKKMSKNKRTEGTDRGNYLTSKEDSSFFMLLFQDGDIDCSTGLQIPEDGSK